MKLPISSIIITERQRIDLGDLHDLDSMAASFGQIVPIVVDKNNVLIDGRRRLAKAVQLGWSSIEGYVKDGEHTPYEKQMMELYADIGRKDRTWQERLLAFRTLHMVSPGTTQPQLAAIMGISLGNVNELLNVAEELYKSKSQANDNDKELWSCDTPSSAVKLLVVRQIRILENEMNRRKALKMAQGQLQAAPVISSPDDFSSKGAAQQRLAELRQGGLADVELFNELEVQSSSPVNNFLFLPLHQRAAFFNIAYPKIDPLIVNDDSSFLYGYWFLGGGNVSTFYGAYSTVFFERITKLFSGAQRPLHLFAGSLPASDKYIRVGLDPTGQYKYEIECDAEHLSSNLKVREYEPDIIFADPPYSVEDMEHYQNEHLVNRAKVVSECARVLVPGGFLIWLDQVLPVFSNDELHWIGLISYIRSTANRFRCVTIFQKPL